MLLDILLEALPKIFHNFLAMPFGQGQNHPIKFLNFWDGQTKTFPTKVADKRQWQGCQRCRLFKTQIPWKQSACQRFGSRVWTRSKTLPTRGGHPDHLFLFFFAGRQARGGLEKHEKFKQAGRLDGRPAKANIQHRDQFGCSVFSVRLQKLQVTGNSSFIWF